MDQRAGRAAVGMLGAAATLLLHSLFFAVVMWGEGAAQRFPDRPDAIGTGANQGTPEGEAVERRMIVRLLSEIDVPSVPSPSNDHLSQLVQEALKLEITGPDALPLPPLVIEPGDPAESSDAELMARAKMAGIYESQIRARIERAWMVPEGLSKEAGFSCRAVIRQRRDGHVSEVELPYEGCEGTPAMRQSLISAIFMASPLPAPPHPGVFVDSFSLIFRSNARMPEQRKTLSQPPQQYPGPDTACSAPAAISDCR